eukprot:snap_masked-scaffold_42-processed-gene-2.35-mRNA-1 protein AED:1.00 eAED:1.00 QI:0/-1/0/0/-1/1/1/0/141
MSNYDTLSRYEERESYFEESIQYFKRMYSLLTKGKHCVLIFSKFDEFYEKYAIKGVPLPCFDEKHKHPLYDEEDDENLTCTKARRWFQNLFLDEFELKKYEIETTLCFVSTNNWNKTSKNVFEKIIHQELLYPPIFKTTCS